MADRTGNGGVILCGLSKIRKMIGRDLAAMAVLFGMA